MALLDFNGSPHGGSQRHLPEWQSQPKITPTTIIDHSIVGSGESAWEMFATRSGLESHFIVLGRRSGTKDGHIWQLMDTARQADANLNGNGYALSIETEDDGDPDNQPWTGAQLRSLIWLHAELRRVHPTIPQRESRSCADPAGHGYHTIHGAPSCWTPVAKSCPGRVRVVQWRDDLLPAYLTGQEADMPLTDDDLNKILGVVRKALVTQTGMEVNAGSLFSKTNDIQGGVDRIEPTVNAIKAAIDAGVPLTLTDDQLTALAEALADLLPHPTLQITGVAAPPA